MNKITKIIVGTENSDKIAGVQNAFRRLFGSNGAKITGLPVSSGVPKQPTSEDENRRGAFNRVYQLFHARHDYDFYIGIESGLKESNRHSLYIMRDWVCIANKLGQISEGSGGGNYLPQDVCDLIRHGGMSVNAAMHQIFSNYAGNNGVLAHLTKGTIGREEEVAQVTMRAMIPFLFPHQYGSYLNWCRLIRDKQKH